MRMWPIVIIALLIAGLVAAPAEAKKKKHKPKAHPAVHRVLKRDVTQEEEYVRADLLKIFWSTEVELTLRSHVRGLTPYAGLNAWIAQKVALGYYPYELPSQAKLKYCNYWIEEESYDISKRLFRISPEGWCYPMKKIETQKNVQ